MNRGNANNIHSKQANLKFYILDGQVLLGTKTRKLVSVRVKNLAAGAVLQMLYCLLTLTLSVNFICVFEHASITT